MYLFHANWTFCTLINSYPHEMSRIPVNTYPLSSHILKGHFELQLICFYFLDALLS